MLRLFLFGALRIEQNGQPVPLRRNRALALLAYLAVTRQPQERDTLLGLLWPEFDDASARNNLRRELSLLKSALGEELLIADRRTIGWNKQSDVWVDVAAFTDATAIAAEHGHAADTLCAACVEALAAALPLTGDDLMAGFQLPASPAFDEWLFFQREEVRQQVAATLGALCGWHTDHGAYELALPYARRWLAIDPLHEPAQRAVMQLYAWLGQHAAALRQYDEFVRLLQAELGAEPEDQTSDLYLAIKARRLPPPIVARSRSASEFAGATVLPSHRPQVQQPVVPRATTLAIHTAPPASQQPPARPIYTVPQTSGFVGRQRELADLIRRLTDPACRLLTLVGPGGVGKTRLALEAARIMSDSLGDSDEIADGILFVPLPTGTNSSRLVAVLAATAQFDFYPGAAPEQQLLDFFRTKRLLLILDNAEQLYDDVGFIEQLLATAPRVRLLATSRAALNLQAEWFHPLDGMSFPDTNDITSITDLARFDAIKLFDQHARRVRSNFSLSRECAAVVRLCRLVGGMPLALELAAAWLKALSVEQINLALEQGLDILTARERMLPERHRSIRTVLEGSWQLLSPEQQHLFARMAVFGGGFSTHAIRAVTGHSLVTLAALVEHSLVRGCTNERFSMNELLRQFAAEQLSAAPAEQAEARHAHAAFYLDWIGSYGEALSGGGQQAAIQAITVELENIRLAWQYAVDCGDAPLLYQAAHPLAVYFIFRGPYGEGAALLEGAITSLRKITTGQMRDQALARILVDLGWLYLRLGRLNEARTALEESQRLYDELGLPPAPGRATDPLLVLADLAMIAGNYAEAASYGDRARRRSEAHQHRANLPYAWYALTEAALAEGQYERAQEYAQNAYNAVQISQDHWYEAYLHSELGHVAVARGQYDEARQHYGASYGLREEFGDPQGMAEALGHTAKVALLQEAYIEAIELYGRICSMHERTGDRGGLARALNGLGLAACRLGDYATTRHQLRHAYTLAAELRFIPLMLTVMANAAELLCCEAQYESAATLLLLIRNHAASDRQIGERIQFLLQRVEMSLDSATFAAISARAAAGDFESACARTQAALAGPVGALPPLRIAVSAAPKPFTIASSWAA